MLKRLELVGFKSFADRTRFDFAPGITAIVGPNGSGKSNVVDAVRWLLGEQSAKSLRGGEMADVIFNGSSSRRSLGLAEVTVVFDNTRRLLAVDADEVQLTRRVYRDGTGEYLINGQPARLKDFKDIFLGSGAGAGGYTIIAQGRVDELLQASTRDRREIFDEAAGISRFKAKKTEALRKLAAVEVNLTRSKDRLDSLDSQLRTLRMQAAKAQKYQEYSGRLRELRLGLAVREYRELTAGLATERQRLEQLQADLGAATRRTGELEAALRTLDRELGRCEDGLRHQEARLAEARQLIAGFESTLRHERSATAGFEAELLKLGRQRADLGYRTRAIESEARRAAAELTAAEDRLAHERQSARAAADSLAAALARVAQLERQIADDRDRHYERVREAAAAQTTASNNRLQVERLQKEYARKLGEIEQASARRQLLAHALDDLSRNGADVQARLTAGRDRLESLRGRRHELADRVDAVQAELERYRVRQGDLRGRIGVLEELDRSLNGLGAGVRAVLESIEAERQNPHHRSHFADVIGLVADLLTVPHELAPFVELALGETAQRFVVRSPEVCDPIATALRDVPGRVGFLPLPSDHAPRGRDPHHPDPSCPDPHHPDPSCPDPHRPGPRAALPGSLAASVSSDLPGLAEQLLGQVFLVGSLSEARRLIARYPDCRVVTRTGELLEADGRLSVGPPKSEAGLVSRKSELRELREQFRAVSERVTATEEELAALRRSLDSTDEAIEAVESEVELLSGEAGDLQREIARQRQQVEQLDELIALLRQEATYLEEELRKGEACWVAARQQAEQAEQAAVELKNRLDELQEHQREAETARQAAQEAHTAAQVALSRAVAEHERARERLVQLESELRKRRVEAVDITASITTVRDRLLDSTLTMLRATAGQADAYREKEHRERLAAELAALAGRHRAAREQLRDELDTLRSLRQERQNQVHSHELAVRDLLSRREAVAQRIREDYGVELAELVVAPAGPTDTPPTLPPSPPPPSAMTPPPDGPAAAVPANPHAEIEELRKKIARLGAVNLEALDELARVEGEFTALQAQHDDLNAGRQALQETIDEINATSRRLFTETLAAVRGYFQELFRKLFGGGQADIVLEDESDVLESGIEITARPPGKELRALSLLSGGEKTLTAVALLLAIFRNKPSPFCILDEVDAALDEANTQRLAGVLREFLDRSQFIVVTHKKRTMAAADLLWGVTMPESGVSRLLPLRFEDWPDEATDDGRAA